MSDLRRAFKDRDELIAYLRDEFPEAAAIDDHVPATQGGREAAERLLQQIKPVRYAKSRNFLDGDVTHLSPYIRYGVLHLREVREYALSLVDDNVQAEKFINELGTRDFFQHKYAAIGDAIWDDVEAYKTGYPSHAYADELPEDIAHGETGIAFIDDIARRLITMGYLHNRERMWIAAYIVHWRKIKWQAGARWFLTHLLDGDPASNNLSWQWVASTFAAKPYYYNWDNVKKFQPNAPPEGCEPFDASYDELARRLFPAAQFWRDDQPDRSKRKRRRR